MNVSKRLAELDVLLNHMDICDWAKISDEIIEYIDKNKDNYYTWTYDESKSFDEQNIHKETFAFLTVIVYEYIASQEEREELKEIFKENTKLIRKKYSVDNLVDMSEIKTDFSNNIDSNITDDLPSVAPDIEKTAIIPIESKSVFKIIKSFFRKLFHK